MKKYNKNNKMACAGVALVALASSIPVNAMQALDDSDLSFVTGQDGLSGALSTPAITISSLVQCPDTGVANCTVAPTGLDASKLSANGIRLGKIGLNGAAAAGNWTATVDVDAFTNSNNHPGVAIATNWTRGRLAIDSLTLGSTADSMGNFVLDSSGHFDLASAGGLFNTSLAEAKLQLRLDNATLFLRNENRNGAPELEMTNLNFLWDMPQGVVGLDANKGLVIRGDVNFNLTFDLLFDQAGATPLQIGTTAQDIPILHYGWVGGLQSAEVTAAGGGAWLNTSLSGSAATFNQKYIRPDDPTNISPVVVSQGLNFSLHWNYKNDFRWVVGEVDPDGTGPGLPAGLEFGDWQTLPNTAQTANQPQLTTYGFDFPLIVLDMMRVGRGPGGLCWGANWEGPAGSCEASVHGGQYIEVAPEDNSMAVLIRDGFLRAYSNNVKIIDPPAADRTLGWALIYTLGNIDANIFLRPDERAVGTVAPGQSGGLKLDMVLMSQTFDVFDKNGNGNQWEQGPNWGYGSHFMIADTAASPCASTNNCLGIGLLNSSLLVAADNLYFNYLPQMTRPVGTGATGTRSGGISIGDSNLLTASPLTTSPVRLAFNGRFGGGDVPNMTKLVSISDVKMNFEFDRFHFMMNPPAIGEKYLGYEATVRFTDLDIAGFSDTNSGASTDPGSFFVLAEPGRPEASFRFADMRGWLAARNGRVQIKPDADTPADTPAQLVLENTLLIGRSVSNVAGAELAINRLELSSPQPGNVIDYNKLGSIVIPSGQWYSRIALQPKL